MRHEELERWYRLRNLKRAALFLVVTGVAVLIVGYAIYFLARPTPENFDPPPRSGAGSKIENFSFSAPGATPWELKASTALVSDDMTMVILTNPRVTYEGGKGGTIHLSADSGELDRKSNNVYARGNVLIRYRDMTFITTEVKYSQENRMAETPSMVQIKGNDMQLSGRGLKLSIEKEEVEIEQDVQARLLNLHWTGPTGKLAM